MRKYVTSNLIAVFALIISLISLSFGIKQFYINKRLQKLHIDPSLEYFLLRMQDKGYVFVIKNSSPIPIVNLSVNHRYFVFLKKSDKYHIEIPAASSIIDMPGQNWIFRKELDANEVIEKKEYQMIHQLKFYQDKALITAIFEITYYRESDMKQYTNKAIFFLDEKNIYSFKNALKHDFLKQAVEQLPQFEFRVKSIKRDVRSRDSGSDLIQKAE